MTRREGRDGAFLRSCDEHREETAALPGRPGYWCGEPCGLRTG